MSRFSPKAIEEFKEIYLPEFGENITDDQTQEMGISLLGLFDLLLQEDVGKSKTRG